MALDSGQRVNRAERHISNRQSCAMIALAAVLGSVCAESVSAQCMYELTAMIQGPECGVLGPSPIIATSINDHGFVVGHYNPCITGSARPFMWSQETGAVPIPLPPGVTQAFAHDVNSHGEIVGALTRTGVGQRAFRYKDGVWTELPPTGSGTGSRANAINDDGWVVGYRDTDDGIVAFRWRGDVVEEYQPRSGDSAHANDINEINSAVGQTSGQLQGSQRAFWWTDNRVTVIPPLPGGETSDAEVINDGEVVAGTSGHQAVNQLRSWLYFDGDQVDLDLLRGTSRTRVLGINNAGQIVGRSEGEANGTARPFLWQHGQIHDLEALIIDPPTGFSFKHAYGMNNLGQIVGQGWLIVGQDIVLVAVVLTPIDRPLGDINIDCIVDERDLIAVLEGWGPDKPGHIADIVTSSNLQPPGDGNVDGADLAVVLGNWSFSTEASVPMRCR